MLLHTEVITKTETFQTFKGFLNKRQEYSQPHAPWKSVYVLYFIFILAIYSTKCEKKLVGRGGRAVLGGFKKAVVKENLLLGRATDWKCYENENDDDENASTELE